MKPHNDTRSRRCTRRTAIKNGLAGVLMAGIAPMYLPSRLFGASAPSRRLTVAIIGNGLIASSHIDTLIRRDDCEVIALCDVWRSKAETMRARAEKEYAEARGKVSHEGIDIHARHEDVMARGDIDVVFVTTPDHWHVPISIDAVRAGKDVYCEKPLSLTVAEGRTLVNEVRRSGRILQTGSHQRSETAFRRAATIVRNGWIGDIRTIKSKLGHFPAPMPLPEQPVPEDLDYDRWLGPTPWRPFNSKRILGDYGGGWRVFWEFGGRKNGDWGAHHFDIIQWALGMDRSGPVEFVPAGWEGTKYQTHRYANGITVERVDEDQPAMIEFIGTKGRVRVGRNGFLETEPGALATRPLRAAEQHLYASDNHHSDFFECVRTRQHPICDVEIGHRTATICHLNNIARWLGRPLRWDPARETVVGDEIAVRHLDRVRRAPYATL